MSNVSDMSLQLETFNVIILIPRQPVFVLTRKCCMLSIEATNINIIVFGVTRPEL